MARFRLILAWLLLAALPVHGFAAAGMLMCGPGQRAAVLAATAAQSHGHGQPHEQAGHSHAAHGHGHHAPATDELHAQHPDAAPGGPEAAGDGSHSCSACAASCHAVALTGEPEPLSIAQAPHVPQAEAFTRYHSRPPPVPDKPPRA